MSPEKPESPEKKPAPDDKRKEERYPTELRAKFRRVDPKDLSKTEMTYHQASVRDMSKGGMRIQSEIFMPIGQTIEIFVDDRIARESFFATVETVRSRKEISFYELGVKIIAKEKL